MHSESPRFQRPSESVEQRVEQLLGALSLEEKIRLLGGKPGPGGPQANSATYGIEHIGLPELRMADGPTGVHWWCEHSTTYPALLCAAASWDGELWYRLGAALGRDCRARGVHILLAPGVNIYRSPLCGRNFEYAGEDPWLSSRFGVAYVRGVQDQGVCATIKHYAVNFQEYGRHTVSSDVDERTLHEIYLPAFRAAVVEGGTGALMTAYNPVNGVHCSQHAPLIDETLKRDWGFDGVVMSDWLSTYDAAGAANAGLDLEMPTGIQFCEAKLLPLLESGEVEQRTIDDKVRRLLRLAVCFGWLDGPQKDDEIPYEDPVTAQVALDVARQGMVLLENRRGVLPLDRREIGSIAVLGPYAHPAVYGGGGSSLSPPHRTTSVLEGVRRIAPKVEVLYARGPDPNPQRGVFEASDFGCEQGHGLWGEYFDGPELEGEPALQRLDEVIDFSWGVEPPAESIRQARFCVRWSGWIEPEQTGKHVFHARSHDSAYRIWLDGELLVDAWSGAMNGPQRVDRRLEAGRRYSIRIEFKKTRFFTGMQFGWCATDGGAAEIAECVQLASRADAAIVTVGWDNVSEAEGFDRQFSMSPELEQLLLRVAEVQPNTIVVVTAGGNLDMDRWAPRVAGVIHTFYPGQAGGQAIAEIVFGLVNPSGKLPFTMERRQEERSSFDCYQDDDGDRRVRLSDGIFTGYRHADARGIEPRYPFGFGLSYTTFEYGPISLSASSVPVSRLQAGENVVVSVEVKNTGERGGGEVVQVYVSDEEASLPRPPKELKGFARLALAPGESRLVEVALGAAAFSFYDPAQHAFRVEPGRFRIHVGASSRDLRGAAALLVE